MGYAKYVGRVGALALALGIGTAVATPAWAEAPSGSDSTSSASETSQKPSTRRSSTEASPRNTSKTTADNHRAPDSETTDESRGKPDREPLEEVDVAGEGTDGEPTIDESAVEPSEEAGGESFGTSDAPITNGLSATTEPDTSTGLVTSGYGSATSDSTVEDSTDPAETERHPVEVTVASKTDAEPPSAITSRSSATNLADSPAPAPLVRQPQGPLGVILGGPAALLDIASNALHMLLNPDPSNPGDSPLLLGVLAFVRREIQRTFFNSSPTARADLATTSQGPTRIAVLENDTDPDLGDVITVASYTQAAHGSVSLNADGTFTYTPTAGFSGTDTFTYTISDAANSWHSHGLFGSSSRHNSKATVTIAVTAGDAPVFADPPIANLSVGSNGVTTGRFVAVASQGETVTYGLVAPLDPVYASLEINSETGDFIFKPTELARFRAAVAPTDENISFTVTASDGTNTATLTHTLAVVPLHPDDDGILDLAELDTLAALGVVGVAENEDGSITAIVGDFTDNKVHNAGDALEAMNRIAGVLGAEHNLEGDVITQSTQFNAESEGISEITYRLVQRINGIRVLGNEVILTTLADGSVTGAFSGLNPGIYQVDTSAAASIDEAFEVFNTATQLLLNHWDDAPTGDELEAFLANLSLDEELVIYAADPERPHALAWRVNLHTGLFSSTFFIHANGADAGTMLAAEDAVLNASTRTESATGLPPACSPRSCTITVRQDGNSSLLIDDSRNITIRNARVDGTFHFEGEPVEIGVLGSIVERGPSGWDPSAVSAMRNIALVHDYYRRLGWDFHTFVSGGIQVGLVDRIEGLAKWDSNRRQVDGGELVGLTFTFGEDSEGALDVVGHEYTHAVIQSFLGSSISRGAERAALDEAYGDIMGSLIENKDGDGRWVFGEDHRGNHDLDRDMRHAVSGNDPHLLATQFNKAAYLMMSRNPGVSKETWAKIFYTSIDRLPSNATFQHARNAVIASANVQGLNAEQQKVIAKAFDDAGIGSSPQVKIILTWGASPSDLDSHLTGPPSGRGTSRFHTYYMQRTYFQDGQYGSTERLAVDLDYDDTTSYGPESTTIRNLVAGDYYFYVHDFTNRYSDNSSELSRSGVTVKVYKPNQSEDQGLLGFLFGSILGTAPTTFQADNRSQGTLWTVFKLTISATDPNNPTITVINQYSFEDDPGAIGQSTLPGF
ncbi:hypothetical protein CYL16_12470 [Mycobacterium sp. EPG1]|nr:hypothetical protein CYL16_12470 [Mycobacterium sp. EPG1]